MVTNYFKELASQKVVFKHQVAASILLISIIFSDFFQKFLAIITYPANQLKFKIFHIYFWTETTFRKKLCLEHIHLFADHNIFLKKFINKLDCFRDLAQGVYKNMYPHSWWNLTNLLILHLFIFYQPLFSQFQIKFYYLFIV